MVSVAGGGDGRRPLASVVVPNWNGAHLLDECLDALRAQDWRDFETIVVDNGSTDASLELLAGREDVRVVALPRNLGFAGGVNAGIAAARGAVIALLNNDATAEPGWLRALVRGLLASPRAGMATSKVLLHDRRDTLHTTGDEVDSAGVARNRGVWERDDGQYDDITDVFGASGAAAAYRREMLDDVGVLADEFGSYLEDVDLAWRARLRGWTCAYVPDAVVFHRLSATGGGPLASYLVARNRLWLIARNYPGRLLVQNLHRVARAQGRETLAALRSWRGAAARATLRGQVVGLVTWPRMLPARRRIQSRRTVGDAELATWLGG